MMYHDFDKWFEEFMAEFEKLAGYRPEGIDKEQLRADYFEGGPDLQLAPRDAVHEEIRAEA